MLKMIDRCKFDSIQQTLFARCDISVKSIRISDYSLNAIPSKLKGQHHLYPLNLLLMSNGLRVAFMINIA